MGGSCWLNSMTSLPVAFDKLTLPTANNPPTEVLELQPISLDQIPKEFNNMFFKYRGVKYFNAIQTQAETSSYDKVAGFKYYLAYRDNAMSNRGTVYAYYDLSNAWETVGPQGFTSLSVENFKMVVDNSNNIYVAYKNVSGHLALQKYSSATWSANLLSTNYLTGDLDIGVDVNNDIFIAFQDLVLDSSNTKLSFL